MRRHAGVQSLFTCSSSRKQQGAHGPCCCRAFCPCPRTRSTLRPSSAVGVYFSALPSWTPVRPRNTTRTVTKTRYIIISRTRYHSWYVQILVLKACHATVNADRCDYRAVSTASASAAYQLHFCMYVVGRGFLGGLSAIEYICQRSCQS